MENELALQPLFMGKKPVGVSANTGLTLYQTVQRHPEDFTYSIGVRETHGMYIVEAIVEGVGVTFLSGIRLIEKATSKEICSIPVVHGTTYSRQLVASTVKQHLCQTIESAAIAEGRATDKEDVERQVNQILDECYFMESRKTVLRWAESVGISTK